MRFIARSDCAIFLDSDSIIPSACSATGSQLVPDWLTTMTPADVQVSTSIMS